MYAADQSIAPSISNDYSAKGESLDTLLAFHNGTLVSGGTLSNILSKYTFSQQFVLQFFVVIILSIVLYNAIDNNRLEIIRRNTDVEINSHNYSEAEHSQRNLHVYTMIICSYLSVVYVVILDCMAVDKRYKENIEIYYSPSHQYKSVPLSLEYGMAGLLLAEDLVVLTSMLILSCFKICINYNYKDTDHCCLKLFGERKWYYIIFGPIMCICIHWYHILIGFIHTPHHATSILVFYGVIVVSFVVTPRTMYYCLSKCAELDCCCSKEQKEQNKKNESNESTPLTTQPTTQPQNKSKWEIKHGCKFFLLCVVAVLLALIFAYIAILFILVPINNAIDDAPDRILTINRTILILFGAAITYKLFHDKKDTFFDFLVKAEGKSQGNDEDWTKKSTKEKRECVAEIILKFYKRESPV